MTLPPSIFGASSCRHSRALALAAINCKPRTLSLPLSAALVEVEMAEAERYQHYEILKREDGSLWELGRGAMGITYKAYDTNLRCSRRAEGINSAYLESETVRQRFLREARAAAALRHRTSPPCFISGRTRQPFLCHGVHRRRNCRCLHKA